MPDPTNRSPRGDREGARGEPGTLLAFPSARRPERPTDNLPREFSSFVGREREVSELKKLLVERRLLTLSGPGGAGKTRLALAVAQDLVENFEDGVWWVELSSTSDPDLVPRAVASALGMREMPDLPLTEVLARNLKAREALLILDNCEHLIEACARLADNLLRTCPNLHILATSREPLRISGEASWSVPGLSLPDPGSLPPAELTNFEAVRLFVERAREAHSGFALTEQNAPALARLSRKLDGIPLPIELAAARIRVLTVEQILERLEDPLALLTSGRRAAAPRHQTLRATLQWSYELLSHHERVLLDRLSVFAGGWTLGAAEAVGTGGRVMAEEVLDLLSRLVEKSLVVVEDSPVDVGALRYGMLEPIRQFGREKLEESGEAPEARLKHAEHFMAFAEMVEPELLGRNQELWLQRLRVEFGNFRAALSWSLQPDEHLRQRADELRLRLVAALWRFWDVEGFEEGKQWLQTALESDPGGFPAVRAKALGGLGFILLFQQDYGPAIAALEEAVALYKELGDRSGAAFALASLGWAVLHGFYRERIPAFLRESEALIEEGLEGPPRAYLGIVLAAATVWEGDLDLATARIEEAIAMCRELGNLREAGMAIFNLGGIELKRGDTKKAAKVLEEGARIARQLGDMLGAAYYIWIFGSVNARLEKPVRAAKLWGAAEALRERMGMSFSRYDLTESGYERDLSAVRSALDRATFEAAWSEGRDMSAEQAIGYALEDFGATTSEGRTMSPDQAIEHLPVEPATREVRDKPANVREAPVEPETVREERIYPAPAPGTPRLRVLAFGQARVERDGLPIDSPDWTQKPRELLCYLLSHPGGRTKEQIGLALWPDASTSQLRSTFHDTLYRLRRALGAKGWISYRKGRYAFDRSLSYYYDVEAFEEDLSEASRLRAEAPEQAIDHLKEAADLYGGDFLEDFADSEWALARQEELRRTYQESLLLLGGLLIARERYAEAAEAYRKAMACDRLLEEAHRGFMRSQAALGERGGALRHYEELVALLYEQLGTLPAPETTALYERVRTGEEP